MQVASTAEALRAQVRAWHRDGASVALVPTMGNLHAGHYSLVTLARQRADRVVASLFVNPTQFGPSEDFARYPRTPDADLAGLAEHACDLVFAPDATVMYPFGTEGSVRIDVPVVSEPLEGALRPGHFAGVATVVAKLFALVQPDIAVFGRKDYQQLLVIRRLVADLGLPIDILDAPIVREANGLAMSSRNQYLSAADRDRAGVIVATLREMAAALAQGEGVAAIEKAALARLRDAGLVPDYATLRRATDLGEPAAGEQRGLVALIAARLGTTRLIDNLACDGPA